MGILYCYQWDFESNIGQIMNDGLKNIYREVLGKKATCTIKKQVNTDGCIMVSIILNANDRFYRRERYIILKSIKRRCKSR
jgi:hypothetical protein